MIYTIPVTQAHIDRADLFDMCSNCIIAQALKAYFQTDDVACYLTIARVLGMMLALPQNAIAITTLAPDKWSLVEPFEFQIASDRPDYVAALTVTTR
jgi:hypothetical protein